MTEPSQPGSGRPTGTALNDRVETIRYENLAVAIAGIGLVDQFTQSPSPATLEAVQNFVRDGLQLTEERLSVLSRRAPRRSRHFSARARRKPELGRLLPGHREVLGIQDRLYRERRQILRQLGDAVIWAALGMDINRIAPLYREQTHFLPSAHGLVGVLQLGSLLHASGEFLGIENDLTRCAGVGDVTAVRIARPDTLPVMIEVKTHLPEGEVRLGGEAEVLLILPDSNRPADREAQQRINELFGGKSPPVHMSVSDRGERQAQRILERTEVMARLLTSPAQPIRSPTRHWGILRNLLRRAARDGHVWDIAESGVHYFALRTDLTREEKRSHLTAIKDGISRASGIPSGGMQLALSEQLRGEDDLSARVPPIALWDLPSMLRAKVLAGHLAIGVVLDISLFRRLFQERGVDLSEEEDGSWIVRMKGEEAVPVGTLEVEAIKLGVLFAGISPRSAVESIVEGLEQIAAEEGTAEEG